MRGLMMSFTQPNITSTNKQSYLGQFVAETIESSQGDSPTALKNLVPMATQSSWQLTPFQSPQPDFIIFGDFKLKKHLARPQTQLNIYRYVYVMDQADEMVIIGKFQNGTPKVTHPQLLFCIQSHDCIPLSLFMKNSCIGVHDHYVVIPTAVG